MGVLEEPDNVETGEGGHESETMRTMPDWAGLRVIAASPSELPLWLILTAECQSREVRLTTKSRAPVPKTE